MKCVVITGSTRGIGRGLAEAFLQRGCGVVVNGRSAESVQKAVAELGAAYGPDRVAGSAGDVTDLGAMQRLWDLGTARFGRVDYWINNAGLSHDMRPMWELDPSVLKNVLDVNLLGTFYASRIAIRGMLAQGGGQLFNMEGFGSNGRTRSGMSGYGTTKAGIRFLTDSLVQETKGTPVLVGALSPGIVITDLLLEPLKDDPENMESGKRVFNILGDKVETVTPWLADKVLANDKHGAAYRWLTTPKIIGRFAASPFRRRELV